MCYTIDHFLDKLIIIIIIITIIIIIMKAAKKDRTVRVKVSR